MRKGEKYTYLYETLICAKARPAPWTKTASLVFSEFIKTQSLLSGTWEILMEERQSSLLQKETALPPKLKVTVSLLCK